MKKLLTAAAIFAVSATVAVADPVEGIWQTQVDDGAYAHVNIAPCGSKICGTIARTFKGGKEYKSANIGKQIIIGMVPAGNGKYKGKVWRPSNNKIYKGDLQLQGKSLRLRGCVGVCTALTSASQTWARVK